MKRWGPWIGLAAAAVLVALCLATGVLPGVYERLTGSTALRPQATNAGVPTPMEFAEGYLEVYDRLMPNGTLVKPVKGVGVDLSRANNLDEDARAWLLEQIGRRAGCTVETGLYAEFQTRQCNPTSYRDGFFYLYIRDSAYQNGFLDMDAFAASGFLSGQGITCRLQKTTLGWKIDTIGTSIS